MGSGDGVESAMTEEELLDRISEWHARPWITVPLYVYLGWSREQYARWVETGVQPGG